MHPTLIGALAAAGHGSTVLIADRTYPHSTGARQGAVRVYLNLRPGLPTVDDVLDGLAATVPIEAATVMVPGGSEQVPAHQGFRLALGEGVGWTELGRLEFYEACRTNDLAVVIATGEQCVYANLLLTVGVREAMQGFPAGTRRSGVGGADGKHGLLEYTRTQVVYIQS